MLQKHWHERLKKYKKEGPIDSPYENPPNAES